MERSALNELINFMLSAEIPRNRNTDRRSHKRRISAAVDSTHGSSGGLTYLVSSGRRNPIIFG